MEHLGYWWLFHHSSIGFMPMHCWTNSHWLVLLPTIYWSLSCWSSCIGCISIQTISVNYIYIYVKYFFKKKRRKRHIFCLSFTLGGFTCLHLHHLPDQHDRHSDRPGWNWSRFFPASMVNPNPGVSLGCQKCKQCYPLVMWLYGDLMGF